MDFTLTSEQEAFRERVRALAQGQQSRRLAAQGRRRPTSRAPRPTSSSGSGSAQLYDAGFIGLTWPKEAGGQGLTFMEELILHEEMAVAKAPPILNILGVGMAGPTIVAYGTDAQKKRYPAKILSCEEIWCQGYSEPNSGSDLAALQTRAVKDGDHYVINGQKVWTSLAHIADWMMLLARTDPDAPKHKGITYFLLDMKSPGVTVKPLRQITGDPEFNEVFFDNVRVHESQVLGEVNGGWQVGLTTLMYERLALGFGLQVRLRITLESLIEMARKVEKSGRVRHEGSGDAPEARAALDRHGVAQVHGRARDHQAPQGRDAGPRGLGGQDGVGRDAPAAAGARDGDRGPLRAAHAGLGLGGRRRQLAVHVPPLARELDRGRHDGDPEEHHRRARARLAEMDNLE